MLFEGYERRIGKIEKVLAEYSIAKIGGARYLSEKGCRRRKNCQGVQPIAFDNAVWAYTLGCAIAIKKNTKTAADAAEAIGIGLQAFCIPGSVAETRESASGTAISARCCCARRRSASVSLRAMSRSRPRRAL